MRTLEQDIAQYHAWVRSCCDVDNVGLMAKREKMLESPFAFLRATYFRWAATCESICPELASAPRIACLGDIHVENYGTWRDADGRLVWGINDFDEVATMPYAFDLVRLATSALLAPDFRAKPGAIVSAILEGYAQGLAAPCASLLDDNAGWLRAFANPTQASSIKFWREVDQCPDATPPADVQRSLVASLPKDALVERFASRIKGGGSLGRPRHLVIAQWRGGRIVREAKAYVPSAWTWAHAGSGGRPWYTLLAQGAFRSPDPTLQSLPGVTIRRMAPDARKIELGDLEKSLSLQLLHAMGADLAAVHASDPRSAPILDDLSGRHASWLKRCSLAALAGTQVDFQEYSASRGRMFRIPEQASPGRLGTSSTTAP